MRVSRYTTVSALLGIFLCDCGGTPDEDFVAAMLAGEASGSLAEERHAQPRQPRRGSAVYSTALQTTPAGAAGDLAGVASGANGTSVVAGSFSGTLRIRNTSLTSDASEDIFWIRLGRHGDVVQARSFGAEGRQLALALATDDAGRSYLAGDFSGSLDFGNGIQLRGGSDSTYLNDVYVAKLARDGRALWAKHIRVDGEVGTILGSSAVAVDTQGNVFSSGMVEGIASVDGHSFGDGALRNYLLKLSAAGEFQWVSLFPGPDQIVTALRTDLAGNAYVAAEDGRGSRLYLWKWNGAGALVAEQRYPSTIDQLANAYDLAVTPSAVYLTGSGAFGVSPEYQSFLATLTPALDVVSVTTWTGYEFRRMATTPGGALLVAGDRYSGDPPGSTRAAFAARLMPGPAQSMVWQRIFSGEGRVQALASTRSEEALLGGQFTGVFDAGSGPMVSLDEADLFAAKLRR